MPTVRLAIADDYDGVMDLCHLLHRENGLLPLDDDLIASLVHAYLTQTPNDEIALPGHIAVIGAPGRLEGMIALRLTRMPYSRTWMLEELWSYVRPECRRSNNAHALIEYAKRTAREMQMKLLIGIVSNIRTEQKIRLYQRQLGPLAGGYFIYHGDKTSEVSEAA